MRGIFLLVRNLLFSLPGVKFLPSFLLCVVKNEVQCFHCALLVQARSQPTSDKTDSSELIELVCHYYIPVSSVSTSPLTGSDGFRL